MTANEFTAVWDKTKALWGGWAKSIEGPHERFNFDVVYKMFRDLSTAAVDEAVDQHFAEKGAKKTSAFEPVFSRILELAKVLHYAARNSEQQPVRDIHRMYVSMLPRVRQLELEVEWHRRMAGDDTVTQEERDRHAAVACLGAARLARYPNEPTDLEVAQTERARLWKADALAALERRDPDTAVRESTRPIPQALSRPSGARRKDSQALGQVWK